MTLSSTRVDLGSDAYSVHIGPGALSQLGPVLASQHSSGASRVFVVHDSGVPRNHLDHVEQIARDAGLGVSSETVTPSERIKSIATFESLLVSMLQNDHTRRDPVLALGGGIVGDLAGFAAASLLRGVPVIQCPTTLLSMVDASVGGKTGFNLSVPDVDGGEPELLKNMVGAFHQPVCVLADTHALASLDDRVFRSGFAECVKHACISATVGDPELLGWMREHASTLRKDDPDALRELVHRNVELKARIVERDEREDPSARAGGRMLLNLGHTFAHALETLPGISPDSNKPSDAPLMHGEAVALGVIAAFAAAQELGRVAASNVEEIRTLINALGLPVRVSGLPDTSVLIQRMSHDKKAHGSKIRLVLPDGPGSCSIIDDVSHELIGAGIAAIS